MPVNKATSQFRQAGYVAGNRLKYELGGKSCRRNLLDREVDQPAATNAIVPYDNRYQSGLAPTGRLTGVFLLLGLTVTRKTKTVEAIADLLHGSERLPLKIDCGEFQMDHETAKLVGAPPGYLGHRETVSMLTQQGLEDATSPTSDLALVLFAEARRPHPHLLSCFSESSTKAPCAWETTAKSTSRGRL